MNRTARYLVGAAVLITVGVLLLLQNLGVIVGAENVFWTLGFFAGGVIFLSIFAFSPRSQWWAVIPGMVLLGLGIMVGFGESLGQFGGAVFLIALALSFWLVLITNRTQRWAVIPAGVLTSVAVVSALPEKIGGFEKGGILFIGLAATFGLVALLFGREHARWAMWPALILLVVGLAMFLSSAHMLNWIWAVGLILVGLYLVIRALLISARQPKPTPAPPAPPSPPQEPPAQ
ncbi:MAG: hypothetical protein ACP5TV_09030 [Anaerolineae bacterium]